MTAYLDALIAEAVPEWYICNCDEAWTSRDRHAPECAVEEAQDAVHESRVRVRALIESREREAYKSWLTETHAAAFSEGHARGRRAALESLAGWIEEGYALAPDDGAAAHIRREALRRARPDCTDVSAGCFTDGCYNEDHRGNKCREGEK